MIGDSVFALLEAMAKAIIGLGMFTAKAVILIGSGLLTLVVNLNNAVFKNQNQNQE